MKKYLLITLTLTMLASYIAFPVLAAGKSGQAGKSNVGRLYLYQKNSTTWEVVGEGGAWGKLVYNLSGPTFDYLFNGHRLDPDREYCLIYYADYYESNLNDRFTTWGGNYPGALIARGTTNRGGNLHLVGSVELDMNLPSPEDGNAEEYDYSGEPDYYTNAHGAKIWLVPAEYYAEEEKQVTTWEPDSFLFESDLIHYTDIDLEVAE